MFKSKQNIFIVSIVAIIILVIGVGFIVDKTAKPGKYDSFAQSLKSEGATFYGAFWCPHCQNTKALFGSSKKYLPYVECSNPDRSQTKVCVDNKIDSYPAWNFKNGITVDSTDKSPVVCSARATGVAVPGESEVCDKIYSTSRNVWVFSNHRFSIMTEKEPVHNGDSWVFSPDSLISGEVPLEFLAKQINFVLPQ